MYHNPSADCLGLPEFEKVIAVDSRVFTQDICSLVGRNPHHSYLKMPS